jgi:hypothetical protein
VTRPPVVARRAVVADPPGQPTTLRLYDDEILQVFDLSDALLGTLAVTSNANDFADQFLGLRSDTAIRRIAISSQRPEAQQLIVAVDDLTIGLNPQAVPEPATLTLSCAGLVGILSLRQQLRRSFD